MTSARRDGLLLLVLAGAVFLASGFVLLHSDSSMPDFKGIYYGARCLLQHSDPYKVSEILRIYQAEAWQRPPDLPYSTQNHNTPFAMTQVYFPSTIVLAVPFALLNWGPAHILWISCVAGAFLFAAVLAWDLAADYAPVFSALLTGFLIVNSLVFFTSGNPAGMAVSLCVIAVWSSVRGRCVSAGICCLAVSLTMKPHDAGMVWLYFFLVGGVQRRRALHALAITAVLGLVGVLWVSQLAPHWFPEMRSNLAEHFHTIDDPSLKSPYAHTATGIIDLQTVISIFRDDPRIYNPVSYLVVGALLLLWSIATIGSRCSSTMAFLALAPAASLTMLPVYHRTYDAKLLMLAIPACAMLIAEGGLVARLVLLVNASAIVLTGDIPLTLLLLLSDHVKLYSAGLVALLQKMLLFRPVPLALLLMSVVNLWIYYRRFFSNSSSIEPRLRSLSG